MNGVNSRTSVDTNSDAAAMLLDAHAHTSNARCGTLAGLHRKPTATSPPQHPPNGHLCHVLDVGLTGAPQPCDVLVAARAARHQEVWVVPTVRSTKRCQRREHLTQQARHSRSAGALACPPWIHTHLFTVQLTLRHTHTPSIYLLPSLPLFLSPSLPLTHTNTHTIVS